jgi:hypothetical protein
MDVIRAAAPEAGSYVNETDYHQPDWQHAFGGDNYARLVEIKHTYDPGNLFLVHHGVGSETPASRPRDTATRAAALAAGGTQKAQL